MIDSMQGLFSRYWFELFVLIVLFVITGVLHEVAQAIGHLGEAVEAVRQEIENLQEAMCKEADEYAWADEGHQYSFIDRLKGHLSAIDSKLSAIESALMKGFRQAALRQAAFRRATLRQRHPHWMVPVTTLAELQPGNLVVHAQRGLSRYLGVKEVSTKDGKADYFYLQYAEDEHFYVPVEQLDSIFKYVGPEPVGLDPL